MFDENHIPKAAGRRASKYRRNSSSSITILIGASAIRNRRNSNKIKARHNSNRSFLRNISTPITLRLAAARADFSCSLSLPSPSRLRLPKSLIDNCLCDLNSRQLAQNQPRRTVLIATFRRGVASFACLNRVPSDAAGPHRPNPFRNASSLLGLTARATSPTMNFAPFHSLIRNSHRSRQ